MDREPAAVSPGPDVPGDPGPVDAADGQRLGSELTVRYIVALTVVALLTVLSGIAAVRIVDTGSSSDHVIDVAGRQRMLSHEPRHRPRSRS